MRITKEEIIKALETEPLAQGKFIYHPKCEAWVETLVFTSNPECKVCAVGAVLRNKLPIGSLHWFYNKVVNLTKYSKFEEDAEDSFDSIDLFIDSLIEQEDYLSALSVFFEDQPKELARENTIEFVKDNFPEEIEVNL